MNFNNENGALIGNLTTEAADLNNTNENSRLLFFTTVTSSPITDVLNLITGFFVNGKQYVIILESEIDHNLFIDFNASTFKTKKFVFQLEYGNPNNSNYIITMPTGNILIKAFLIS